MKNKSKRKIEYSKPLLISAIVVTIALIVTIIINKKSVEDYSTIKADTEKYYVYTYKENERSRSYIPQINIFSKDAVKVNKEIIEESEEYLKSNTSDISVSYKYNQYKNILSVVMTYKILNTHKELEFFFKTYIFDLKQDGKLLTDEEILNMYDLTSIGVDNLIKSKLLEIYNDEVSKGIINKNSCDYKCFLRLRGSEDFSKGAKYYIENGHLVAYRAFNVYSEYNEEKYFTRDNFKFIIK